jgi:hypothetical protein
MKTRDLVLVILSAILAFGGSFTCKSNSDSDEFTENPATPAK